jgi:hypothetical protein
MRILVCGGRTFIDQDKVFAALARAHQKRKITRLIHGDSPGAERLAGKWAEWHAIERATHIVDWTSGPAAEAIRNERMFRLEQPEGVIAFPGDGADDCVRRADAANIPVWRPYA